MERIEMAKSKAEFDIVVYGASGFTGRLVAENRDKNRETNDDRQLQQDLAAVAEKYPPAARNQGRKLTEKSR